MIASSTNVAPFLRINEQSGIDYIITIPFLVVQKKGGHDANNTA